MMNIKIAVVCSPGGHFIEMSTLADIFQDNYTFLVTHKEKFDTNLKGVHQKYLIPNIIISNTHRNKFLKKILLLLHMFIIAIYEIYIFLKEKPNLIISTGSEIAIPIILFGTVFKAHTIYIESITRINEISTTGKVVYHLVDLFLVQHEQLLEKYPNAIFRGSII